MLWLEAQGIDFKYSFVKGMDIDILETDAVIINKMTLFIIVEEERIRYGVQTANARYIFPVDLLSVESMNYFDVPQGKITAAKRAEIIKKLKLTKKARLKVERLLKYPRKEYNIESVFDFMLIVSESFYDDINKLQNIIKKIAYEVINEIHGK